MATLIPEFGPLWEMSQLVKIFLNFITKPPDKDLMFYFISGIGMRAQRIYMILFLCTAHLRFSACLKLKLLDTECTLRHL